MPPGGTRATADGLRAGIGAIPSRRFRPDNTTVAKTRERSQERKWIAMHPALRHHHEVKVRTAANASVADVTDKLAGGNELACPYA